MYSRTTEDGATMATIEARPMKWMTLEEMSAAVPLHGGQNLLDHRHIEFGNSYSSIASSEVPRGGFLRLRWTPGNS